MNPSATVLWATPLPIPHLPPLQRRMSMPGGALKGTGLTGKRCWLINKKSRPAGLGSNPTLHARGTVVPAGCGYLAFVAVSNARFREHGFIELWIHHDLFDDDFLWRHGSIPISRRLLGQWKNPRLQNVRNL